MSMSLFTLDYMNGKNKRVNRILRVYKYVFYYVCRLPYYHARKNIEKMLIEQMVTIRLLLTSLKNMFITNNKSPSSSI